MSVDIVRLRRLCDEMAFTILCLDDINNIDIHLLSNEFFKISKCYLDYAKEFGSDDDFIIRAVNYLSYTHAIPPCGKDTSWFSNGLSILFELSYPNTLHTKESSAVMADIKKGINNSLNNLQLEK
ncbi:hypothetical protein [Ruminiclostridium papyrosolvens]|uniref:Uncharacterized protein n=1 Tax=Ruminiclostridium papyrosolvens C7 TaxID=1330534 RepID=U4R1F4_9FIRM|nr:hypothetical protein [Ruminiclostridium papyrosolvens]EPR12043.1 hypothetical protein L323_09830 [Ruminiclostridium papyrosolvens C7]